MPSVSTRSLARHSPLIPFAAVALIGGIALLGWWTGRASWVQLDLRDLPLPANAALSLLCLGLVPFLQHFKALRAGSALAIATALFVTALAVDQSLNSQPGFADLLTKHEDLVDLPAVGRVPFALAFALVINGAALACLSRPPTNTIRPLLLALAGSLTGAYGFTALTATRIGLAGVQEWQTFAAIGPQTAVGACALGLGLVLLAARDSVRASAGGTTQRWLWLPIVTAGATVTLLFWVSLREREIGYVNNTTQLAINNVAAVFSSETESQIKNLRRMAERWTDAGGTPLASWEKDARSHADDFPAYRSISWVDANLRTRWFWPRTGNEAAASYDHSRDPLRATAMAQARESLSFAIAAPLAEPHLRYSLVVYATVLNGGTFDGFIAGELGFQRLFEIIDARLNISQRYVFRAQVLEQDPATGNPSDVVVFSSSDQRTQLDERLRQSAVFNLLGERITFELTPRPEYTGTSRQFLPEVVLASGLFVSLLVGLVVNLAQAARSRQTAAESTSDQLRSENEQRRRIEEQLKVADERLNLALEATQVGVLEWSLADGRAIYSAGFWNALGYDSAEMPAIYDSLHQRIHPSDRAAYQTALDAHLAGRSELVESEFRVRARSGDWHWFALRAKCVGTDRVGRPRRMSGTCQNITARKRAEEALRASQAATRKLSLVASRADNAVIITGPDGRIEWVNESFTRLTEHTLDDIGGRPFVELLASPENDPDAVTRVAESLDRREPITTDVIHRARSGRSYHVHLQIQPVKNDEGELENFIAMETDVTSRVEVEQQLRRAKSEADSASRAKSDFLAAMSHEIRTPMNGVIGMTSLLSETDLTPDQHDYVQTIRTSGDALLSIINEILDFSKIESGRMELERLPFSLSQCVDEAIDIFALQAARKGIEMAVAIEPDVPRWISGDITRLRQVLVNLLNNAVKFTAQGAITVEVRRSSPSSTTGPLTLEFTVTDTGIGIPPDRLSALFQPFSQVDSSTTRKYGGTGLGLAICHRLVQLMGGAISVRSQPQHGSQFTFTLQAEPAPAQRTELLPDLRSATILAVDDRPVGRRALEIALHSWNARPLLCDSASAALALTETPAAAIIDHDLAGTEGASLIAPLRARFPQLPIILLVAASEGTRPTETNAPFILRLPKPLRPALLAESLASLLQGISHAPAAQPPPSAQAPLGQTLPLDILLVEDNPVNQKVALHLLARLGYRADAVSNGLEAIRAALARDYDIIFMDVQMPEMDGFAATAEIRRQLPADRQPQVIALTANAVQGDRERCLAAGMNDYLAKPVKLDELRAMIAKCGTPPPAA